MGLRERQRGIVFLKQKVTKHADHSGALKVELQAEREDKRRLLLMSLQEGGEEVGLAWQGIRLC